MSDKTPRWPGPDGKPGVSFAPKDANSDKTEVNPAVADSAPPTVKTKSPAVPSALQPKPKTPPAQAKADQAKAAAIQAAVTKAPPTAAVATQVPDKAEATAPMWANPAAQPGFTAPAPKGESVGDVTQPGGEAKTDSKAPVEPVKAAGARRTRKARLRLSRVDPWSVMKTSFLFSIAFGVMLVISAAVLWSVVQGSGALEAVNSTMTQLIGDSETNFDIEVYINSGRVIGFAAVLAAVDVVILTAVATLFAFLYNLAAAVIGGLEVTLAED